MNLYLISQDCYDGYGTFDSMVVVAATEEAAIKLNPCVNKGWDWDAYETGCWPSQDKLMVKFLGVADDSLPSGVVCASFNAG